MSVLVPAAVRTQVVQLAAEVLGALDPAAVPASLAAVRRFAPRRRADSGAGRLWAAVEGDDAFRTRVGRAWSQAHPEAAAAVLAGERGAERSGGSGDLSVPVDPLMLAVGAVLLRPEGWAALLGAAAPGTPERSGAPGAPHTPGTRPAPGAPPAPGTSPAPGAPPGAAELHRLAALLAARTERAETAEAEVAALRKEVRRLRSDADRARAEARRAAEHAADVAAAAERVHEEAARTRAGADEDRRRAEDLVRAARQDAAVLRDLAEVRVRLLLDTLVEAGAALREELALPPVGALPADLVAPEVVPVRSHRERPTSRGRGADDPALLDELLAMPRAHLVVDGYNVSKLAWPDQSLAEQRRRLTERLANLAGRTGAEVTCCFDGRDAPAPDRSPGGPRAVRVLFSHGEIADDLIRRIVRAEPAGRVVVAVTSDRALGADLDAAGARVLPSATLLARLGRV